MLLLMIGTVFSAVFSAAAGSQGPGKVPTQNPEDLDKNEIRKLHRQYNITENDVKFVNGELPNYLNGTLLDGTQRVIASETGEPPEGVTSKIYDELITMERALKIDKSARQRYQEKHGVDPSTPKVEMVGDKPLPKKYVKKLVKEGYLPTGKPEKKPTNGPSTSLASLSLTTTIEGDPSIPPYAVG